MMRYALVALSLLISEASAETISLNCRPDDIVRSWPTLYGNGVVVVDFDEKVVHLRLTLDMIGQVFGSIPMQRENEVEIVAQGPNSEGRRLFLRIDRETGALGLEAIDTIEAWNLKCSRRERVL